MRKHIKELAETLGQAGLLITEDAIYDLEMRTAPIPTELKLFILRGDGNPHHLTRLCLDELAKRDAGWNEWSGWNGQEV